MMLDHPTDASPAGSIAEYASASGGPAHRRQRIEQSQSGGRDPGQINKSKN
jgi:hypothetical protein